LTPSNSTFSVHFFQCIQIGALQDAEEARGTSIDYKIQKQLAQKRRDRGGRQQRQRTEDFQSDEDKEEEASESEEAILPGEDELSSSGDEEKEISDSLSDDGIDDGIDDSEDDPLPGEESVTSEDEEGNRGSGRKSVPIRTHQAAPNSSDEDDDNDIHMHRQAKRARADSPLALANGKRSKGNGKIKQDGGFFDAAPEGTTFAATSFADLNLSRPLVRACAALGYTRPTPIQAACVPLALTGRDICGSAITGSGKTAAFSLPLLERLLHRNKRVAATYVLVLAPTRELAVQVHSMIGKLAQFTDIRSALVVGGLSLQSQATALRAAPEIVVATPVSLLHMYLFYI